MRYKVSNSECLHLWASRNQSHAKGYSVSFQGNTCYSWGHHFPMASFVDRKSKRGKVLGTCVLYTTRTYSASTAKHLSLTRRAIPGTYKVFHVPFLPSSIAGTIDHKANLQSYRQRIKETFDKALRCRDASNLEWQYEAGIRLINEAREYSEFFKLRVKFRTPVSESEYQARHDKLSARADELRLARELERRAHRRRILVENIHTAHPRTIERLEQHATHEKRERERLENEVRIWRAGGTSYGISGLAPMLRVRGNDVETSWGARFPVKHAKLGLALVRRVRAAGESWQTNGHTLHLGPYKIESIDASGNVRAGCHNVSWSEIEGIQDALDSWSEDKPAPEPAEPEERDSPAGWFYGWRQ